jgi:hypothetical protein
MVLLVALLVVAVRVAKALWLAVKTVVPVVLAAAICISINPILACQ